MTRYPGVMTWAYIISGLGHPRLVSGQSTDSADWTVTALGETVPNRWDRSALASSVARSSADSSSGGFVGVRVGVAVGERGVGLGDGAAVVVGVKLDAGVGAGVGVMLGLGIGDGVVVGRRVAVGTGLGDGSGVTVGDGDGAAERTTVGAAAGDRTVGVGVWVRVASLAGTPIVEAGDSAASSRVAGAGSPQPPAADATKTRASETASAAAGYVNFDEALGGYFDPTAAQGISVDHLSYQSDSLNPGRGQLVKELVSFERGHRNQ